MDNRIGVAGMGDFYFNSNSLEELCSKVWGCQFSLKTLSEEAKRLFTMLESQRGMGIEEIRQQILALSVQTANLSGSMGDTAYFLKKVASYVQEAEQKSVKDMENSITHLDEVKIENNITSLDKVDIDLKSTISTTDSYISISELKSLLTTYSKLSQKTEFGAISSFLSYLEDFWGFFTGDKKGLTGAADYCDLVDSSIGLWDKAYDYFQKEYPGLQTGFFGTGMQKNVAYLGITGASIGLLGSLFSASAGIGNKNWQSSVADFIESLKNISPIVKSAKKVKDLKDVHSLVTKGPSLWDSFDIYSSIADSTIEMIGQGFKSHEKYYADGKWNFEDTSASMIDVALSGIYGLGHSLSWGLDDVIFGKLEKLFGGDGNSGLSYVEQAAEGYKIWGRDIGKKIGIYWQKIMNH